MSPRPSSGEEGRGDGPGAPRVLADLVVTSRDIPNVDAVLLPTLAERTRLYEAFVDARKRFEAAAVV